MREEISFLITTQFGCERRLRSIGLNMKYFLIVIATIFCGSLVFSDIVKIDISECGQGFESKDSVFLSS